MELAFKDCYVINDTFSNLDFDQLEQWLTKAYWSPGIKKDEIIKGVRHSSIAVGCYLHGRQVGFLRVVSDKTRFGYFLDVYVDEAHRGMGMAQAMMRFVFDHPDFTDVYIRLLLTKDAHGVYGKLGFVPVPEPQNWMWIKKPRKFQGGEDGSSAKALP